VRDDVSSVLVAVEAGLSKKVHLYFLGIKKVNYWI